MSPQRDFVHLTGWAGGVGHCLCPACGVYWGVAWPPISICPSCLTPENMARRPRQLPGLNATINDPIERKRWMDMGWILPPVKKS